MADVSLTGITKSFGGTPVLKGVSLDIEHGEFLTLVGPSGCGKSTLLRVVAGLEPQDAGSVRIAGRPVDHLRPKRRDVAMVFQSYALYPQMTVAQNLAVPLRMRRLGRWQRTPLVGRVLPATASLKVEIDRQVREVATLLEIAHLLHRKPAQLSGGQRQRVAVGRAMVRDPAVFLMDEPLSNLDAKLRVAMRTEIKELHRRLGTTFLYVTHDQAEAMTMSDRVAVMLEGELIQVASPRTLYADPDHRKVAELIGSPKINTLQGRADGRGIDAAGATLPIACDAAPGTSITVGIRPEAVRLAERGGAGTIAGRVRLLEHLGADLFVHLDVLGQAQPLIVRAPPERWGDLAVDAIAHVVPDPARAVMFAEDGARLRPPAAALPARAHA